MTDSPLLRLYRAGDEARILELFERSFHTSRSAAGWDWKYRRNPNGNFKISLAFDADGTLLAHYAGYPCRFREVSGGESRTIVAHQIGDTMTARRRRADGALGRPALLQAVTRQFFDRFCEGQVGFNYGFNTGKIQRYYLQLVPGSRFLEPAPQRVLELGRRYANGRGGVVDDSILVERQRDLDGRWDEFFDRVAGDYGLLVERDATYLRWRYLAHPETEYFLYGVFRQDSLLGWSVFRQQKRSLLWGDALFDRCFPEAPRILLRTLLSRREHRAVRRVEGWFPVRPGWWDRTLLDLGFESRPEPQELGMIYKPFEEADLSRRLEAHLYYTKGDGDLF